MHSRRFFCDEPSCERRIFCERLPEVAVRARTSNRLEEALLAIAFELGGRAGARLALELGLLVGRDALLKRIRSTSHNATFPEVKVLGVDDFAFRKAHTYGTILVDLERHKVVDLLPDRSSETLADWLRQNSGGQTVSRDRSATYAEGIATGAPQATQVADRWHLVRNLAESLEVFLVTKRPVLKAAARPGGLQMTDNEVATEESVEHTYVDPAAPKNLDAVLYEDFTELRRAREAEDDRIEAFVPVLDEVFLERSISYANSQGRTVEDPTRLLVARFFNHQTHHRGQAHDILSQKEVAPPVLDLHRILRP